MTSIDPCRWTGRSGAFPGTGARVNLLLKPEVCCGGLRRVCFMIIARGVFFCGFVELAAEL